MTQIKFKSGIYRITNVMTGKFYIGSTKSLNKRRAEHFRELRKGTHKNRYLQTAFRKAPDAFVFEVVEYVAEHELLSCEQNHLDVHFDQQKKCYNINPLARSSCGRRPLNQKPVFMFSKQGQLLCSFESAKQASQATNINASSIVLSVGRKIKTAGGFLWSRTNKCPLYGKPKRVMRHKRQILSPDGIICTFFNLVQFCEENKLSYGSIRDVLCGRRVSCNGWRKIDGNH